MPDLQQSDDQVVDEVTGLANRRGFLEILRMEERRRTRYGGAAALMVVDVERALGARAGRAERDAELVRIAALLTRVTRDTDTLGRIGDCRFALLAIGAGDDPGPIAGRLRLFLEMSGVPATVTVASPGDLEQSWRELDAPARPVLRLVRDQ